MSYTSKADNYARKLYLLILLISILTTSCAREFNPNIERGSDYKYRSGYPEVRFLATGFLNENNQPNINLSADIVYGSLIFKNIGDSLQGQIAIDIRIIQKAGDSSNAIESKHYEINIEEADAGIVNSQQSYIFQRQINVPAGSYKVYFTITDLNSDKKTTRIAETSIPNPDNNKIDLTDVRMLGKDLDMESPEWLPITTYDVAGRIDSLMFISQITNNRSDQPLEIQSRLISFYADTSVARPLFYSNYNPSAIEYRGIRYSSDMIEEQSQRKILQEGSVFIEYKFAQQSRGNYRFEITSSKLKEELYKARDFSVKSENYPTLQSPRELARPLIYLMEDNDYEELMAIKDQDSLKKAIDKFWLKNIGDQNKAKNIIQLYYHRVEQANKQFSNFKEGWKTDPGMVFILFGPPVYVNERGDTMQWAYSNNVVNAQHNFYFNKPTVQSEFFPFSHYVAIRSDKFYQIQYQQKNLWLSGLILTRNI